MELRKEEIDLLREKCKATSQVTFDMDFNVPDAKPDMGRMIQNKGAVCVEDVRLSEGHANIRGNLCVDILYVAEQEQKVYSLSARLPVEEVLNLDGIVSGDKMCLRWEIEDLSVHMIHSRKLNVKAIVTFFAAVEEVYGIRIPVSVKNEDISVKKEEKQFLNLKVHKKDTMRLKEELTLAANKPNITEILWNHIEVRGMSFRPGEQVLRVKGELNLFVLYTGDDEGGSLHWQEYAIPFGKEIECSGSRDGMISQIEAAVVSQSVEVKPDADGEERILVTDVVVELGMKLYEEEKREIILDLYTPVKECILQGKNEILEQLLIKNDSKLRIVDHVEVKETQGKILQICSCQGKVKTDRTRIVKNGIQVDGILLMKILYITGSDEQPFYSMEAMVPFSHVAEVPGIEEKSVYSLQAELEQLSTTMVDSNEIEIRALVSVNAMAVKQEEIFVIDRTEEQPLDMQKLKNMPGIVVYMVKEGDTLWDIAKKYYTTVEEIVEQNGLKSRKAETGQPLLLVKKVNS